MHAFALFFHPFDIAIELGINQDIIILFRPAASSWISLNAPNPGKTPYNTRLAPSPTGEMHAGNIWSFLLGWLMARKSGGRVLLRIDDLDPARSRAEYARNIIDNLAWLGFDWDDEIIWQSSRGHAYKQALARLGAVSRIYPCFCTRQELRSLAGAPHIGDCGPYYPGTCGRLSEARRKAMLESGQQYSLRLACPPDAVEFEDIIQGRQHFSRRDYGGDFPIKRSDGVWAYQLASTVDDIDFGVNLIVRGRDLLSSTPRQLVIQQLLDAPRPTYAHLPLLLDEQGERLAKRHKALSIAQLRKNRIGPEKIIGSIAFLANINPARTDCLPAGLLASFSMDAIPKADIKTGSELFAPA